MQYIFIIAIIFRSFLRDIDLRLPRVAHLAELLARDGKLELAKLPLTIGQAKRIIEKNLI